MAPAGCTAASSTSTSGTGKSGSSMTAPPARSRRNWWPPASRVRPSSLASTRPTCAITPISPSDRSTELAGLPMRGARITITIDQRLLSRLDRLVKKQRFPNRSRAIHEALRDKLDRMGRNLLARECAKLDPAVEQHLADETLA